MDKPHDWRIADISTRKEFTASAGALAGGCLERYWL